MQVKLIAYTKGVGELENLTLGEILAYIARVSNPSNQINHETAPKLLNYCLRKQHWSVFEHCYITFEITTSMAIGEQILRHRSATFQKFSGRYSVLTERENYRARRQDDKNRQNSIDDMDQTIIDQFDRAQQEVWDEAYKRYEWALSVGIAKEQARMMLPASTQTTMYMTANVRTFLTYCKVRDAEGVQKEHRDIAIELKRFLLELCPELNGEYWIG